MNEYRTDQWHDQKEGRASGTIAKDSPGFLTGSLMVKKYTSMDMVEEVQKLNVSYNMTWRNHILAMWAWWHSNLESFQFLTILHCAKSAHTIERMSGEPQTTKQYIFCSHSIYTNAQSFRIYLRPFLPFDHATDQSCIRSSLEYLSSAEKWFYSILLLSAFFPCEFFFSHFLATTNWREW